MNELLTQKRLIREYQTIGHMIGLYCRSHHDQQFGLCADCAAILEYAETKLNRCSFRENKPTCIQCPIHCYKPEMQDHVREVMRFAGPCMLWHHPILAIRHLVDKFEKIKPKENRKLIIHNSFNS